LEVSQNYTSNLDTIILVIFLELFIHTQTIGCGQGGKQKDDIFGFKGGYLARFVKPSMWVYTMHGYKGLALR
jgi:hypothetical protein